LAKGGGYRCVYWLDFSPKRHHLFQHHHCFSTTTCFSSTTASAPPLVSAPPLLQHHHLFQHSSHHPRRFRSGPSLSKEGSRGENNPAKTPRANRKNTSSKIRPQIHVFKNASSNARSQKQGCPKPWFGIKCLNWGEKGALNPTAVAGHLTERHYTEQHKFSHPRL
jgi:hypothetical protein